MGNERKIQDKNPSPRTVPVKFSGFIPRDLCTIIQGFITSSSAMAERPCELDQRFQMGEGQFEAIID